MAATQTLSDHLLRTLAAVPPQSTILEIGSGTGTHTEALLRLGFPLHACAATPEAAEATRAVVAELVDDATAARCVRHATAAAPDLPEATFDWVVLPVAERYVSGPETLATVLQTARRVLKPGGWCYLDLPAAPADVATELQTQGDGAPSETPADPALTIDALNEARVAAGLAEASAPTLATDTPRGPRVRMIFRCLDPQ
ncbi:class I SAM-dependent methyltransferase [Salisaeta longa]|uniref:class I SAM-dependent methyltransferase n=1 Tax=Salisaeta longa TaxID=503170 RepID=UPI0003B6009C|nr:class I SAM-dependent methyltransferase [Salisaeta longa]